MRHYLWMGGGKEATFVDLEHNLYSFLGTLIAWGLSRNSMLLYTGRSPVHCISSRVQPEAVHKPVPFTLQLELLLHRNELLLLCCVLLADKLKLPLRRVHCVVRELIVHVWSQPEYYRKPRGQESD